MNSVDTPAEALAEPATVVASVPALGDEKIWNPVLRVAFRFAFVYFSLYVVATQMVGGLLLGIPLPDLTAWGPVRAFFLWVGAHFLGVTGISFAQSGSGDTMLDWVMSFSLLLISVVATIAWSLAAGGRLAHTRLYAWFRFVMRFSLGTTLLGYGMTKVFPMQMPILSLTRLVEPFGNFSPMGVLWYSVGAAPAYEIITGFAEVAAGLLLFWPRTATLGALLAMVDMSMVFTLNMTYDVPVKLFSFHLLLLSLVLLAPNIRRFFDLFLLRKTVHLAGEPDLVRSVRANRNWQRAQLVFACLALAFQTYGSSSAWSIRGGAAPKSPLFGIWDVTGMTIDGVPHPALLTDTVRAQRMIFQTPASATMQRMNDTFVRFGAKIDSAKHTLKLTASDSSHATYPFTYSRQSATALTIDGTMYGQAVHMNLQARDLDSFLLRSRGFHWIQDNPFNR